MQLHHAGILDLDEFVKMPRKTRDILVSVIVPKKVKAVVYLSQRNQSTDFPVLTCAVAKREEGYVAAVGATPHLAETVWDKDGILTEVNEENIEKFAMQAAEQIRFGSNMRAGADDPFGQYTADSCGKVRLILLSSGCCIFSRLHGHGDNDAFIKFCAFK